MLSYDERSKIIQDAKKTHEEAEQKRVDAWLEECKKNGVVPPDQKTYPKQRCDHPNTMEDNTATIVWIVVMIVGSIFKGNWVIWIIATVIWWRFISRYK